jgi:DNA (cytosine-5)-methyltransferase 1
VRKEIRGLAWVVIRWAQAVRPRVICLENVEEFETWGPVVDGRPCPARRGETFRYWHAKLESLGYRVEWRSLVAADYGAPTTRKRLYLIARCDGQPIVWPEPTHGARRPKPWRSAAECIQWELPCPSIFDRARPLAEKTLRRVAAGIDRYVLRAARPFVVTMRGTDPAHLHGDSIDEPLRTVSARGTHHALASPTLIQTGYGERPGQAPRVPGLEKPLGTLVNGGKHALVAAFIARHFGGMVGAEIARPLHTVTSQDHHSLVTATLGERVARVRAFLTTYYGTGVGQDAGDPLRTVTSHDRFGLVTIDGADYAIEDIGLRMLAPRELYRAQGFPDSYVIDRGPAGALTKTAQIRLVGNSVAPPVAEAIVRANYGRQSREVAA